MRQEYYANDNDLIPSFADFAYFRRNRALVSWLLPIRPDIAAASNLAAWVTAKTFSAKQRNELNNCIRSVKKMSSIGLKFGTIDLKTLHIRVYIDTSFEKNGDLSFQLGTHILLCDGCDRCHIIDYHSHKSRRVVRSIMGGEVSAFMDGFVHTFSISRDLEMIL